MSPEHGRRQPNCSRIRSPGGEIVEVQGGHIVRSIGRKDRHSKVCTAKGPRDRRVRLSATTAIQFYDVQDRLGYDRPSKAVDWLMKNAKAAIDELAQLPAWQPSSAKPNSAKFAASDCSFDDVASSSLIPPQSRQFEDLRLSLQSVVKDPGFEHSSAMQGHHFLGDCAWNAAAGGGGFAFNLPPAVFGHAQLWSQRGPLQSSNASLFRPWMEQPTDVPHGFSGYREVLDDGAGFSDKPSSGAAASHY